MRKLLLGTTAIVGLSVLAAGAATAAEPVALNINGWLRFESWFNDQDNNGDNSRGVNFKMDDVEIHFDGKGVADNGLEYGFRAEVIEGGSNTGDKTELQMDQAFVYFQGNWGLIQAGTQDGAEDLMKVFAVSVAADKDGAYDGSVEPLNVLGNRALTKNGTIVGDTEDANKISYYTPSFGGFRAGVSYTPDGGDVLRSGASDIQGTDFDNHIGAGVEYKATLGGVGIHASAIYATSDLEDDTIEEVNSWGVGARLSYAGFSVAGAYRDSGDSALTAAQKAAGLKQPKWWDIGIGYATGPYKVSAIYMNAKAEEGPGVADDEVDWIALGFGYNVAPGLDLYAEYQWVDLEQDGTASDNEANLFVVGTQISF